MPQSPQRLQINFLARRHLLELSSNLFHTLKSQACLGLNREEGADILGRCGVYYMIMGHKLKSWEKSGGKPKWTSLDSVHIRLHVRKEASSLDLAAKRVNWCPSWLPDNLALPDCWKKEFIGIFQTSSCKRSPVMYQECSCVGSPTRFLKLANHKVIT